MNPVTVIRMLGSENCIGTALTSQEESTEQPGTTSKERFCILIHLVQSQDDPLWNSFLCRLQWASPERRHFLWAFYFLHPWFPSLGSQRVRAEYMLVYSPLALRSFEYSRTRRKGCKDIRLNNGWKQYFVQNLIRWPSPFRPFTHIRSSWCIMVLRCILIGQHDVLIIV